MRAVVVRFKPKYRLAHPENYLFSLSKKNFSGWKYPKKYIFYFGKGSTAEDSHGAVGDIHGDIDKALRCLELAGVAEVKGGVPVWTGDDAIVVQLGDILDRGDAEVATLMLLRQLHRQAEKVGGAIYVLNGNHESLNVCGDFRYALHSQDASTLNCLCDFKHSNTHVFHQQCFFFSRNIG